MDQYSLIHQDRGDPFCFCLTRRKDSPAFRPCHAAYLLQEVHTWERPSAAPAGRGGRIQGPTQHGQQILAWKYQESGCPLHHLRMPFCLRDGYGREWICTSRFLPQQQGEFSFPSIPWYIHHHEFLQSRYGWQSLLK